MEIETDCETVEVASVVRAPRKLRTCPECGAAFMPRNGGQVCCSDDCKFARKRRLQAERRRRERGDFDRSPRVCPECNEAFQPRYGNQVCCSDECRAARHQRIDRECRRRARGSNGRGSKDKRVSEDCEVVVERVQRMTLDEEREEKARRRAAFFPARDAAFERAGLPIPKILVRDGVRIENRGVVAGRPSGKSSLQISSKSYYYR